MAAPGHSRGCEERGAPSGRERVAWEDLWELFEVCRWLSSRSDAWEEVFSTGLRAMLPPMERAGLPGEAKGSVFISSDATTTVIAAIDWAHGLAFREDARLVREWAARALAPEEDKDAKEEMVIHLAEMLSFVAFASAVAERWREKIVVYGGDNQVVRNWLRSRKARVRAGRLLIRVVNMVEMRFGCQILAGWWRTYHNVDADYLTRCSPEEFRQEVQRRGWTEISVEEPLRRALQDSERFGPCFLSWGSDDDRAPLLQLKARRQERQLQQTMVTAWDRIIVREWVNGKRKVRDFLDMAGSLGAKIEPAVENQPTEPVVVCATVGVDMLGKQCRAALSFSIGQGAWVTILEGPRSVAWEMVETRCAQQGWHFGMEEFVTTELGEAMARRRRVAVIGHRGPLPAAWKEGLVRSLGVMPAAAAIGCPEWTDLVWKKPVKLEMQPGIPRAPLLPHAVAHVWMTVGGERQVIHTTGGPLKWPTVSATEQKVECEMVVYDRKGPPGYVREITAEEMWKLQGRSMRDLARYGLKPEAGALEGTRATGAHTASSLLCLAGRVIDHYRQAMGAKAGMGTDGEGGEALAQLLLWLRRWRRGDYPRNPPQSAVEDGNAGGGATRVEAWWFEMLDEPTEDERRAGGRRGRRKPEEVAAAVGEMVVTTLGGDMRPFSGKVNELVEEWLEDHMTGDKAQATERAYASAWEKWKCFARRQEWESEYLNRKADMVENENKILSFLGYLGWLGASSNTLRQHLFAVKNAHRRAGQGDPTEGMHRSGS